MQIFRGNTERSINKTLNTFKFWTCFKLNFVHHNTLFKYKPLWQRAQVNLMVQVDTDRWNNISISVQNKYNTLWKHKLFIIYLYKNNH